MSKKYNYFYKITGYVKYVLKTKIDEYLNNGWDFGRPGYKPVKNGQGKSVII